MNLKDVFTEIENYFSPRIIGEVNNHYIKVAKIKGQEIPWHNHENEDELFYTEALNYTAPMLFKGDILKTFEVAHRQDLAMLFLKINDYVSITLEMFWGLWLFPFGQLVYKSGFIPRILGIFLIANGIAYIIHFFTHILLPNYQALVFQIATPIWTLGEISIMLWLLIKGVKNNVPIIDKQ